MYYLSTVLLFFCSAGRAQTVLVGGVMALVGHLQWEAVCVCAAPAPPILTTMLQSRSLFFLNLSTPTTLCHLIIHPHHRYSFLDILVQGEIEELCPWSSQSCSGQADPPLDCPQSRSQILGGGVRRGQGVLLLEDLDLVVVWEWTTVTAMARHHTLT